MKMTSSELYNKLNGNVVDRRHLKEIYDKSIDDNNVYVSSKLLKLLMKHDNDLFDISLSEDAPEKGLTGTMHTGLSKIGLDDCGRLNKGFRYVKGKIVAVKKAVNKPGKSPGKSSDKSPGKSPGKKDIKKSTSIKKVSLKQEILNLRNQFGLGYSNRFPEITKGLNGSLLADGHEIISDSELSDYEDEISMGLNAKAKDVEAIVNQLILDKIKSGEELPPWRKTWANYTKTRAQNFDTKKEYSGSNSMILNILFAGKFNTPYYLTFNQIEKRKGAVKKGTKGIPLVYYNFVYILKDLSADKAKESQLMQKVNGYVVGKGKFKKTITQSNYAGTNLTDADLKKTGVIRDEYFSKGFLRYYSVFNLQDTTGIDYELPENDKRPENEVIIRAEAIVKGYTDKPEIGYDKDSAYYVPALDIIKMPKINEFDSSEEYYTTLFHEMIHSTLPEKRLNREALYKNKDKDSGRAFEELIAELGASYLAGLCGILESVSVNSSTYLKGWHKTLQTYTESNQDFFVFATKEAQKAVDYILKGFVDPDEKPKDEESQKGDMEMAKKRMRMRLRILELEKK